MEIKTLESVPAIIKFNYDEILKNLTEYSQKYNGLIVTEENLKEMINVKNELLKVENFVEDFRKQQKKEMEKPIKAFELKCKTLLEVIKNVSEPIKLQLNEFEEKRKAEKEAEVQLIVNTVIKQKGLNEKYASQLTIIPKYLNKTQKDKDTKEDLEQRADLLLSNQKQEEQLIKIQNEKLDLIQSCIEETNKKYGINLKISDFPSLMQEDISNIPKKIEGRGNYLYQEKLAKINADKKREEKLNEGTEKNHEIKEKVYNFSLSILNCSSEKAKLLKIFLEENNIEFKLENRGV